MRRPAALGVGVLAAACAGWLITAQSGCFLDAAGFGTGGAASSATSSKATSSGSTGGSATSSSTGGSATSSAGTGGSATSSGSTGGSATSSSSTGGATSSSSTGAGGCSSAADCPTSDPCKTSACVNHACQASTVSAGTMCKGQPGVCDPTGACVTCFTSGSKAVGCTGAGDYCFMDACASCTDGMKDGDETGTDCGGTHCSKGCGLGQACQSVADCASPATECTSGKCTACADKMKDGDETDVDCGGSCPPCALGKGCQGTTDCATNTYCASGVCCNSTCTGNCMSCSLPGAVGTCTNVPAGATTTACGASSYCNTADMCTPVSAGQIPVGSHCTTANYTMCTSRWCGGGFCKVGPGAPCARDVECVTSFCSQNVCAWCKPGPGNGCASGTCNSFGECELPAGAFCDEPWECLNNTCDGAGVCSLQLANGAACTASADCKSQLCKGNVCSACTAADCPSCNAGACLAPSGAGCVKNGDCDSGQCVGTPPYQTCQ